MNFNKKIGIFVDVADSTTTMMTVIYSIYESNGLCLPFANRLCFAVNPIILLNKIVFIYLVITIREYTVLNCDKFIER